MANLRGFDKLFSRKIDVFCAQGYRFGPDKTETRAIGYSARIIDFVNLIRS